MAGYQPYPEYKESGVEWLGEVPRHWNEKRLKFTVQLINEKIDAQATDLSYMGLEHIESWSGRRIDDENANSDGVAARFIPNDVLFGKLRPYLAKVYLAQHEGLVSTEALVIRPTVHVDSAFLRYFMVSQDFICTVDSSTYGSKMPRASWDFIGNIPMLLPEIEEQQTIARFLDHKTAQIDALIAKKQTLLEKLAEKRTALISHAVTKGLNPNVKMKDSGVEWLGQVPEHWSVKKLKFFVTAYGGGTPNTGKPEYWDGDIPWVSPKDMKTELISETEDYLTELGVNESATKLVPVDAVLIVVRSGILRHTIPVARNLVTVSLNQDMKALIPNNELHASFLHRLIQGNQKGLLPLWSKPGCTVESIEYSFMANTEIAVPSIPEQQDIVEYLDIALSRLDQQVRKAQQTIEKLQEYRTALITHAVTGKIDVRGWKSIDEKTVQKGL